MKTVYRLFIAEERVEFLDETGKLDLVAKEIMALDVDPASLVYCGVEGRPLVDGSKRPVQYQTFGCSYEEFESLAGVIDKVGSAEGRNPLQYAFDALDLPALIGYEQAQLRESRFTDSLWLPRAESSLEEAARVLILFAL